MNTETAHALYQRLAVTLTALLAQRADAVNGEVIQEIYEAAKWNKGKQRTGRAALDKSKDFLTVASEFSFAASDALDSEEINEELWESLSEAAIIEIPALMQPQGNAKQRNPLSRRSHHRQRRSPDSRCNGLAVRKSAMV